MTDAYRDMDSWSMEEIEQFKTMARQLDAGTAEDTETRFLAAEAAQPIIIAEGDSWFDYPPGTDIIDCLRQYHNHRIKSYADAGDTLENMIYGTGTTRRLRPKTPTIERVLQRLEREKPRVFLFSGGGNDVAGEEFESFLNHKSSGLPSLRDGFVDIMFDTVFRKYYEDLITKVSQASPETVIVTHGYGHTVPTGEGVDFLFFTFVGPWLLPALVRKRILDQNEQRTLAFGMIDRFNDLLESLATDHPGKLHYINLRDLLDPDHDWVNELHLRNSAYARVADRFHQEIMSIMEE